MNYKGIVFDLDGTLISSHKTIYNATLKTMKETGINDELPEDKFKDMIGYHFKDIFTRFNINVPDLEEFITIYKSFYFDYIKDSEIYPGVTELLEFIKNENKKIALLTTKAQDQAELILNHFNLTKYFDYIMGRRNGMPHKPSPVPLQTICKTLNLLPEEILMVGDSELDILCGKNANSGTCAVIYGYRDKERLEIEKPDYLIDNLLKLKNILHVK